MNVLDSALALAAQRVRLFPVQHNSKHPAVKGYSEYATSDKKKLGEIFSNGSNSGIACGFDAPLNRYLVGVDIDKKDGRDGFKTMETLELLGMDFPKTWSQTTPSGGKHFLFWSKVPIRQGTDVLGVGVDLRSEGGYLVGPGSSIDGKFYSADNEPIAQAPEWFENEYKKAKPRQVQAVTSKTLDQLSAYKSAMEILERAPGASTGNRNDQCYKVVCRIKDVGLDRLQILGLLQKYWKCEPPLEDEEIILTIESAFKTGKSTPGFLAPENIFGVVPTPEPEVDYIDEYNKKFFFTADGGVSRVCEEVENFVLKRYSVPTFHDLMMPDKIIITSGDEVKRIQKSREWFKSIKRRSYNEVRFIPTDKTPKGVYNLWRGFKTKPKDSDYNYPPEAYTGFNNFINHVRENLCDNDQASFDWLMGFAAHLFQRPMEKPPVAVVFQGEKGTGKNVFVDVLHHLIGSHSVTVSGKHALTSNFNSLMEDKLLVALDEAFWSGDKSVEGILKSMITDSRRNIERKGENPYTTTVYDRIVIMGNEHRLVNATSDERRYAVFNVASHKRGDNKFFGTIMDGVRKHGSDELLMSYFLEYDISEFDIRKAPDTEGLMEQREFSLPPFEQWWRECLNEGRILGSLDGSTTWPERLYTKELHTCFKRWAESNCPKAYITAPPISGKVFKNIAPRCSCTRSVRHDTGVRDEYIFCSLDLAREDWVTISKLKGEWA